MKAKQIFINTIWYGVIPKLSTLTNVILLPFITPYLSAFDYGIYGILTSYSGIVMLLAILGLNLHLTNSFYVYKSRFREVWGRILFMLLLSGLFFSIIYGVIIFNSLNEIHGTIKWLAVISSCIPIAFIANITLAQHYYPLVYRPKQLVFRNLISSLCGILVTFVSIYYFRLGFLGWLFGLATSSIINFILFIRPLWYNEGIKPIVCLNVKRIKYWLKISLPIIPHSFGFILLSSSDRLVMNYLNVPLEDIGLYSNGYVMGDYVVLLTSALIVAIAPRIQELYRTGEFVNLRKLFIFTQVTTIIIVFLFSAWMPQIYSLLIKNPDLYSASEIASMVCFANIVYPFYSFISTVAFIREDTRKILWLVFIPSILNILLNIIFIPKFGFKAAVYTTIIAYWSQLMIPYFISYYQKINILIFSNRWMPLSLLIIFAFFLIISSYLINVCILYKLLISLILIASYFLSLKVFRNTLFSI